MCDPVLAAAVGVQALGSIMQGQQQAAASRYNAGVAENNATAARQSAAYEEARQREKVQAQQGQARANAGASGLQFTGSPLDVIAQNAENAELDSLAIRDGGTLRSNAYQAQAAGDRAAADAAELGGFVGAGTAVLTGTYKGLQAQKGGTGGAISTAPKRGLSLDNWTN